MIGLDAYIERTAFYNLNPNDVTDGVVSARPNHSPTLAPNATVIAISQYSIANAEFLYLTTSIRTIVQTIITALSPSDRKLRSTGWSDRRILFLFNINQLPSPSIR